MRRLLLSAITLYILGPICVNCFYCESVERITSIFEELSEDEELRGASLWSGDYLAKCAEAKRDAERKQVELRPAREPKKLPRMGRHEIFEGTAVTVIGFLVHDNPPVVLTSGWQVYAQRKATAGKNAANCVTGQSSRAG